MRPFDYRKAIVGNHHFAMTRKERGRRACRKSERSDRAVQYGKAYGSNSVLARNSTTRKVAATGRLNKAKRREALVGGIGSSEDQSPENGKNRHRAR